MRPAGETDLAERITEFDGIADGAAGFIQSASPVALTYAPPVDSLLDTREPFRSAHAGSTENYAVYRFHIAVHARPAWAKETKQVDVGGRRMRALDIGAEAVTDPLGATFDEAAAALGQLPRLYLELDGSFLWTAPGGPNVWQTEGVLYDRGDRLHYVELKGSCPPQEFDALLAALGWPATPLAFQLLRHAVYLGEEAFRQHACEE